jgi:hypothetical protein
MIKYLALNDLPANIFPCGISVRLCETVIVKGLMYWYFDKAGSCLAIRVPTDTTVCLCTWLTTP